MDHDYREHTAGSNALKRTHLAGMAILVISVSYMLIVALRQAGQSWWLILSLSGHSTVMVFMLVCLYLLAISKGVARRRRPRHENPLTSSNYYLLLYNASPFLGAFTGVAIAIILDRNGHLVFMAAGGAMLAAFLAWIVTDPLIGLAESLTSKSRDQRKRRLVKARKVRLQQHDENQILLAQIEEQEQCKAALWKLSLTEDADKLARLIMDAVENNTNNETEAARYAVKAWRMGGHTCMRQLHDMTWQRYRDICEQPAEYDYISIWWDGIANWYGHRQFELS